MGWQLQLFKMAKRQANLLVQLKKQGCHLMKGTPMITLKKVGKTID